MPTTSTPQARHSAHPPLPVTTDQPDAAASLSGLGLVAILTAYALPVFNFFAVTVALTSLTTSLSASPAMLQLVVAMFGVTYASTVVLGGRLGDAYGRRTVLGIGAVAMVLTSALCAIAPDPATLIVGRALQGLSAALIAPQVLSTIQSSTEGERRARAMGLFGAMAGIATCAAFALGGLLVQWDPHGLGWRSLFWFEVAISVAVRVLIRSVPEHRPTERPRLDPLGAVLLLLSVSLLVFPLTEGRAAGWPWWTWLLLVLSVPATLGLIAWERHLESTGSSPLLPLSVLREPAMASGLLITAAFFIAFGGFMFVFALVAQSAAGMDALGIGLGLTPFAAAFLASSLLGARRAASDPIGLMRLGTFVAAAGYLLLMPVFLLSWPHFTAAQIAVPLVLAGLGQGMLVVPLFGTILSGLPSAQAGTAGGLLITTMQMALGLGSAVIGTLFLALGDHNAVGITVVLILVVALILCVPRLTRVLAQARE